MRDFLEKTLLRLQDELKELYIQRTRAGIGTVGDFENRIAAVRREIQKITADLEALKKEEDAKKVEPTLSNLSNLKKLVALDQLEMVLDSLYAAHPQLDSLIHIMGRLSGLERANLRGTVSRENYLVERSQIRTAVLTLIESIENQ